MLGKQCKITKIEYINVREKKMENRKGPSVFVYETNHSGITSIYDSCPPLPFNDSLLSARTSDDQEQLNNGIKKQQTNFSSEGYSLACMTFLSFLFT